MGRIVKCRRLGCNNTFPKSEGRGRPRLYCRHACMISAYRRRYRKSGFWRRKAKSDEWYTPAPVIEAARRCLGGIDFDPCSSPDANLVVQASRYLTTADDGAAASWPSGARVWLNPPYSDKARFIEAALRHTGPVVALLPNTGLEGRAMQALMGDVLYCAVRGRIHFWKPGVVSRSPNIGSALFGLRVDAERFREAFAPLGSIGRMAAAGGGSKV